MKREWEDDSDVLNNVLVFVGDYMHTEERSNL